MNKSNNQEEKNTNKVHNDFIEVEMDRKVTIIQDSKGRIKLVLHLDDIDKKDLLIEKGLIPRKLSNKIKIEVIDYE